MRATIRPRELGSRRRVGVVGLAVVLAVGLSLPTSAASATRSRVAATDEITLPSPTTTTATSEPTGEPTDVSASTTAPTAPAAEADTDADVSPMAGSYPPHPLYEFAGRVVADGAPLADAQVTVYDARVGNQVASIPTSVWGEWSFPLPPGDYKVGVVPPAPYLPEFATDKASFAEADVFTNPGVVPDVVVDRPAAEPAAVEGQVLGWFDPLGGATVTVYDAQTGAVLGQQVLGEWEYEYHIGGLPAGDVKVGATRPGWVADFADNKDTFEQADVFTLVAGQTLTQSWDPITLYLDLTPGAIIEGKVVANGSPVAGATVDVLDPGGSVVLATTTSDAYGAFRIAGLAAGDVKVRASKAGLPTVLGRGGYPEPNGLYPLQPLVVTGPVVLDMSGTAAALQGTVRGVNQVTSFDGPLQGVRVTAYDASTGTALRSVLTDPSGTYRFASLPATQVKLRAAKTGYLTTFAYGRTSLDAADVIALTPGLTVTANQLTLYAEAVIEGQVLSQLDPLGGTTVTVFDAGTGRVLRSVTLGEHQYEYRIGGLPAGSIKVRATKAGYLPAFAGGKSLATAGVYTLVAGQTLRQTWDEQQILYLDLAPAAVIEGEVLANFDPIDDVTLTVYDAATGTVVRRTVVDNQFRLDGLPAGDVKIRASKDGWTSLYANYKHTLAEADVFTLVAGQTLVASCETGPVCLDLEPAAAVHGQVLGDGAPLADVTVAVLDATTGAVLKSARSDASGAYLVQGIRVTGDEPMTVKVRFSKASWVTELAPGDPETSGTYAIYSFNDLAIQTVDLAREGVVVGSVLGIDDTPEGAFDDPLPGVRITAYDAATGKALRSVTTDALGQYRITGLAAGGVKIRGALTGWLTTFAYGGTTLATADTFPVQAGQTTTIGEFTMYAESVITGEALGINDNPDSPWDDPLPGVRVTAYDATTGRAVKSVTSDSLGQFRIGGLRFGDYKVRAALSGWITTFATGKSSLATADVLTLVAGQTLDLTEPMVLYGEAVISGHVMGFSVDWDDPLGDVTVAAIDVVTGRTVGTDVTGTSADLDNYGNFRIGGLPAGQYVVRATKAGWSTTWAFDRSTRATADVYTLTAGQHLGIPAPWPMFGEVAVQGQVLGDFDPLGYATVTVFDADTGRALRSVMTDADGYYRVGGLRAEFGGIHLKVRATKSGWYPSWADGQDTMATARVFELQAGETLVQQWDPLALYLDLRPRVS